MEFDVKRARLNKPDQFKRFRVPDKGEPLADLGLNPEEMLIIVERGGARRAFMARQMSYHHVAQGTLGGKSYIVTFCTICHSGVGLVPVIDQNLYHFSAGGLYDGTVLIIDDETRTYWNHISGEALHGSMKGAKMEMFPIQVTNVRVALEDDPSLTASISKLGFFARILSWINRNTFRRKGFFPPGFRKTIGKMDTRLPELTHGLGVIVGNFTRFYPNKQIGDGITDEITGRQLRVEINRLDKVPSAYWIDDGSRPKQLFTRWYGFAYTFPKSVIYNQN